MTPSPTADSASLEPYHDVNNSIGTSCWDRESCESNLLWRGKSFHAITYGSVATGATPDLKGSNMFCQLVRPVQSTKRSAHSPS
mmetsp:Transcript_16915/g.25085  ORF Transcript_16915/g.25085 Transcript_16915/m.25085 type:complete len:84 (+) Transcript_16915:619-870(+)